MYSKTMQDIEKLSERKFQIQAKIDRESRKPTNEEAAYMSELDGAIKGLSDGLPVNAPQTVETTQNRGISVAVNTMRRPGQAKDYESLFGKGSGYRWKDKSTSFFAALFSGRHHPELLRNAMGETVPSDGGFLVPGEVAAKIHAVSLENEVILPRCYLAPMNSDSLKIPAMSIGNHGVALFGGFTASYTAEAGTISEHDPKCRSMELVAKKLTGLIRFSSELAADAVGGAEQIIQICGKGLAWYRDKAFISGSGAGQPLGVLNSPCKVTVAKQTGQTKNTIVYENLTEMMSRLYAGSFRNSIWLCSQSAIPQLLSLSLMVGVGGSAIPVMTESNGEFKILTRPVVFTEKVPALGNEGDISLLDLSTYCVGLRSGMRFDTSIHVAFETDEILCRIIERHDGQSLWGEPLTLADGVTTVSPVVTLADRLV